MHQITHCLFDSFDYISCFTFLDHTSTHLLSVRHISDSPFTLSCDSAHLPLHAITLTHHDTLTTAGTLVSTVISDRNESIYSNLFVFPTNFNPTRGIFTCTASFVLQPYYEASEIPVRKFTRK